MFTETASDTDQECQLSALQHQLDEAKRRHAMMKKARQKYEFQKKQDAYKKQIEVQLCYYPVSTTYSLPTTLTEITTRCCVHFLLKQ